MKKLVLLLMVLAFTLIVAQASADTILLTQAPPNSYQQTQNDPCIFGYSGGTCRNPFGYNNTTVGNDTGTKADDKNPPYTLTTQYQVWQLHQLLGGSNEFVIGYDLNQAKGGNVQILGSFKIDVVGPGGAILYSLSTATSLPLVENGTGYADYLLSTTGGAPFSIAGLSDGTFIRFTYTMNEANDGGEQLWLISKGTPPPVPEPATLLLFGTSMLGAVPMLRRRKK